MSLSMYQASLPGLSRCLQNLSALLGKGSAYAAQKSFDSAILFNARLTPDMFPLSRQVQIATDMAKGCAARLAGLEPPRFEDDETSLEQLQARIERTLAFIAGIAPAALADSEQRTITLKLRGEPVQFVGSAYLLEFVLPNLYFHTSMTYSILRHNGVDIGKRDYLGA